ncbi:MAG: hypothetical protein ACD_3C00242G0004 [uncultured bacterium (gcode 4)]|uniref:Uncharacterized protein n=1 Tax=uncultured bacterium (gcode 4) TaxID=1234023 RepID=K2GV84_9BACT|nr:MAG: hypothetical protein ACD_3C00242G0004 [uncultured bacterium (gcode 4)]
MLYNWNILIFKSINLTETANRQNLSNNPYDIRFNKMIIYKQLNWSLILTYADFDIKSKDSNLKDLVWNYKFKDLLNANCWRRLIASNKQYDIFTYRIYGWPVIKLLDEKISNRCIRPVMGRRVIGYAEVIYPHYDIGALEMTSNNFKNVPHIMIIDNID